MSALAGFLLLAIFWTWPVAAHLSTRVPHDVGDPVLNTWILWWNAHAVPFTAAWWSPPIHVPMRGALALSEHLAGLSLFATPIQLAGGSPLLAYNTCLLLSYALSGWFAYLLVFRLTGWFDAGHEFRSMVEAVPAIERIGVTGAGTLFRLPAQPLGAPLVSGAPLTSRTRNAGAERVEIDLGSTRVTRAVTFNLRWHYPELGERLLIERSEDGLVWEQAWLGWTGALAVAAAIEDPRLAPVRIPLADIRARYLRIYPAPTWLARELAVVGP